MCSECRVPPPMFDRKNPYETRSRSGMFPTVECTCEQCDDLVKTERFDGEGRRMDDHYSCRHCHHRVELG